MPTVTIGLAALLFWGSASAAFAQSCADTIDPKKPIDQIIQCVKKLEGANAALSGAIQELEDREKTRAPGVEIYALGDVTEWKITWQEGAEVRMERADPALYRFNFLTTLDFEPLVLAGVKRREPGANPTFVNVARVDKGGFDIQGTADSGRPLDSNFWFIVVKPDQK
jgi:hypothetical protein